MDRPYASISWKGICVDYFCSCGWQHHECCPEFACGFVCPWCGKEWIVGEDVPMREKSPDEKWQLSSIKPFPVDREEFPEVGDQPKAILARLDECLYRHVVSIPGWNLAKVVVTDGNFEETVFDHLLRLRFYYHLEEHGRQQAVRDVTRFVQEENGDE